MAWHIVTSKNKEWRRCGMKLIFGEKRGLLLAFKKARIKVCQVQYMEINYIWTGKTMAGAVKRGFTLS
jgi:hypothetical protein